MIGYLWRLVRLRLVRFRLETFGLYYPSLPHQRLWWRITPGALILMARRLPSFLRWARDLQALGRGGPAAWWRRRLHPADRQRWEQTLRELDR